MPMPPDQLKQILEAELKRIGVSGVRVKLPTRVMFQSTRGVLSEDMTPGEALDFLESVADDSVNTFEQFSERQNDYLNEKDAEEEEESEDADDEDEDGDDEDPEEPEDEDER